MIMLGGACAAVFLLESPYLGWLVVFMSMAVIGVHGMLSGTASMDFGGKKNVGVAVGIEQAAEDRLGGVRGDGASAQRGARRGSDRRVLQHRAGDPRDVAGGGVDHEGEPLDG